MRRRRTSAWIAGTLGAGLTASIVLAQQIPSTGVGPRADSGASGPSSAEPPSLYGAAGSRGARYLLRNGLDYLQYQQYERALKFLRDAEGKEKELSAKERQDLKRGIDEAQAGLRAAADGSPAYALSDRSKRRGGFTPALPDPETAVASRRGANRPGPENEDGPSTAVAARTEWAGPAPRTRARTRRAAAEETSTDAVFGAVARRDGRPTAEEMPGEPIRLASAESTQPTGVTPTPGAGVGVAAGASRAEAAPAADPQEARGEIAALAAPGIPALTAVPSSPDASQAKAPRDQATEPAAAPAPASEPVAELAAPAQAPREAAPESPAPAPIPAGSAPAPILLETPDSANSTPAPARVAEAPVGSGAAAVEAPAASASPVTAPAAEAPASNEPTPAPALVPPPADATSSPAPAPEAAPPTGGLVPAVLNAPAAPASEPATATVPPAVATEIAPLPPLGAAAARPVESGGAPHREDDAPAPAPGATASDASAVPVPAAGGDELPPLPTDLSRDGGPAPGAPAGLAPAPAAPEAPRVALDAPTMPAEARPTTAPAADDSLPPLPDEAGPRPGAPAMAPAPNAAAAPANDAPAESAAPVAVPTPAPDGPPAGSAEERPVPVPQPEAGQAPEPAAVPTAPAAGSVADEAPAPEAPPGNTSRPSAGSGDPLDLPTQRVTDMKKLRPEQERSIAEAMARIEREELLRTQTQGRNRLPAEGGMQVREGSTSNLQTQTQYDIARAPSPAEARPIKAIPVPEDWVPLAPRTWTPQRKYWAAAATCHLPLYFQDPMLERYGHSVEQFFGPAGRYMTYPVDDPKQSTQRMQILQPVFSLGLFAFQIGVWPYTAIMDAPWEAQYDLGYYRPGDVVPVDVYWLPLTGYGPPLHGDSY